MEHRRQDRSPYGEHEINRDIATILGALQTVINDFEAHESTAEYLLDSGEKFPAL